MFKVFKGIVSLMNLSGVLIASSAWIDKDFSYFKLVSYAFIR